MRPARAYAGVALRKVWASLLWRVGLRRLSDDAYGEALVRAFTLTLDFEPVAVKPTVFSCEHMSLSGAVIEPVCWWGCQMTPGARTRAGA